MALDLIRQQCAFVTGCVASAEAVALAQAFAGAATTVRRETSVPAGVLDGVELTLTYALIRNRHWVQAPLLEELLIDRLQREFGLAQDVAHWLTQPMVAALRFLNTAGADQAPVDDRTFLRYLIVTCATMSDEEALIRELGLGTAVIARIRQALLDLDQPAAAAGPDGAAQRFLPDLEATIAEVTCQLAGEQKESPWALQLHRLGHLTMGLPSPWGARLAGATGWLFEILLQINRRRQVTSQQLRARLAEQAKTPEETADLTAALANIGLIYAVAADSQPESAAAKWQLTPLAQELTADAHVDGLLTEGADPESTLSKLSPASQAALIRRLPAAPAEHWIALALTHRPLSPAGLREALQRVLTDGDATRLRDTVTSLMAREPAPWLRKAACEILAQLSTGKDVGQMLGKILRSDPSPAVRAAAMRVVQQRPAAGSARIAGL